MPSSNRTNSFLFLLAIFLVTVYFFTRTSVKEKSTPTFISKDRSEKIENKNNLIQVNDFKDTQVQIEELTQEQKDELALDERVKEIERKDEEYKLTKATDSSTLLELIAKEDLCSLNQLKFELNDMAAALISATSDLKTNTNDLNLIEKLILNKSPLFFTDAVITDTEDEVLKYFNATALAVLLSEDTNVSPPKDELEKANDLFKELKQIDTENSLYPFLRAKIMGELGYSDDLVRAEFLEAFERKKIETHIGRIQRSLFEKSLTSPAYRVVGFKMLSKIRYPNIIKFSLPFSKLLKQKDPSFNIKAQSYGHRLIDISQVPKSVFAQNNYDTFVYSLGTSILRSLQYIENPGVEWKAGTPFYELFHYPKSDEGKTLIGFYDELQSNCNSKNMTKKLNLVREQYKKFIEKYPAYSGR